jgi:uncharacterized protein involved in high-affinity Fe2+ transport
MATKSTTPPMVPSDESTKEQLQLATKQGDAYNAALQGMDEESGADIKSAGEYEIALVVEDAEGMYHLESEGDLVWKEPESENCHVEVAVRDAADGRFIPGLEVSVTLTSSDGTTIGTHEQPFLWHPWIFHYGRNWEVPDEGDYTVDIHIEPATFMRHDHKNGKRFASAVDVSFDRHIKTGKKLAT